MSRPLRIHLPGMPYHLVCRGNNKQCIFEDDADHERFLDTLAETLHRFATACIAYCLLWNHYHLLVVPGAHSVSRLMQHLNSKYCQAFNRRHGRVGHVLQGRFGSRIVDDDSYLLTALRYIALNPVEAGRVKDPTEWRWSSYAAAAGVCSCPPFLSLDRIWATFDSADAAAGRQRFVAFVTGDSVGVEIRTQENTLVLGGDGLMAKVDPLLVPHRRVREFKYLERFATRPPLARVLAQGETPEELDQAVREAFARHAYTLREIGGALNRPPGTIWTWIQRCNRRNAPTVTRARQHRRSRGQISIFE